MMLINFSIMVTMLTSKSSVKRAVLWFIHPLLHPGRPLPYLYCPEDFLPSEQVEGHLPEKNINGILSNPGEAGAKRIAV